MKTKYIFLNIVLFTTALATAAPRRKVIINEDCSGPGGSNMQTLALMIQSPQVEVLGITVVSGDQWRDEEVAHTLRLLEIMGRSDIPVVPGAAFPLSAPARNRNSGSSSTARSPMPARGTNAGGTNLRVVPPLPEGQPTTKPLDEDAPHFLIRMVHKYPHDVTIYEGGPMTNLALAISLDPGLPELAQQLIFMGGSLSPQSDNPEFLNNPRHEFNFGLIPKPPRSFCARPGRKSSARPRIFPSKPI